MYNQLQLREIFHLEFLRQLSHKLRTENYALKGGVNMRFFFNSFRYSEDMDLDIRHIKVHELKDLVMHTLQSRIFSEVLRPFGIERIIPPNISKAKQTEITQRFKIHLITLSKEDLFTKVEFSRRGFKDDVKVSSVSDIILRTYKIQPILVPHYNIKSAIIQKINALAARSVVQARDIFDLYILTTQYEHEARKEQGKSKIIEKEKLDKAYENIFQISFEQFRDTVLSYLEHEDQITYNKSSSWDEIRLKASSFINELREEHA